MQYFDAGISLLALLALGVFYTRCGLSSALAPLASISTAVLFLALCGVCGLLLPGAFLFVTLALALCIFTVIKAGFKNIMSSLKTPGFLFFAVAGMVAFLWFAVKQPVLSQWDEFSFWGTAVKLMKLNEALYTTAETGWFWTSTEMPALPLLGWFMQFLGATFAPWKIYLGYSLLFFAGTAALMAPFEKKPAVAVGLGVCGLVLPFFFLSPLRITSLSPAYLSAYGDFPAGVWFGGALVFYLALRWRGKNGLWALLPLAALALVKDNTFPIALVAAGLVAADTLLFCPAGEGKLAKTRKAALLVGYFAAPAAAYLGWRQHAAWANAQNVVTEGQATGASPFSAVGESVAQLVGLHPRSEPFSRALQEMVLAFGDGKVLSVSMVGSGLFTLLLVLLVLGLAVLLAPNRRARLRVGLWAGLSTAGFFAFQFVLLTYFAFLNKYNGGLPDYARYSASYFAGWLMLALCLLSLCVLGPWVQPGASLSAESFALAGNAPRPLVAQGLTLALAVGAVVLFSVRVLPGYSVLDYPNRLYASQREAEARATALAAKVEPGARTFYVSQGDSGLGWFETHYYFLPHILDYSGGGGTLLPKAEGHAGEIVFTPTELKRYLVENGCQYVYIDRLDDGFIKNYAVLFTDHLDGFTGQPALYQRAADGRYALVEG